MGLRGLLKASEVSEGYFRVPNTSCRVLEGPQGSFGVQEDAKKVNFCEH